MMMQVDRDSSFSEASTIAKCNPNIDASATQQWPHIALHR